MKSGKRVFIKLGGAAITDKAKPRTALPENIRRLADEIFRVHHQFPEMRILIGHGSGSFGHFSAQKHNTRNGVKTEEDWKGFAEVWDDARKLNELVIQTFLSSGLPVIAFPPSAWLVTDNRNVANAFTESIQAAWENHLIPVVNGDVIFDRSLGGTILSTEEVFSILTREMRPDQIILASREPGVWEDYPANTRLAATLTQTEFFSISNAIRGSAGMDVTGGMAKKVSIMMELLQKDSSIHISITSGLNPNAVYDALVDKPSGTLLKSN